MLNIENLRSDLFGPISFSVGAGECLALRGPSGAGKSLILRAIVDLDPNHGNVRLGDMRRDAVAAWRWRRNVALVPAESGWWADTVNEHFPADALDLTLIQRFGLEEEVLNWPVSRLSTGERQRLAIIRALCLKPKALLLDEPTAALDTDNTEQVEAVIKEINQRRVPIVLVTHDDNQAKRLAHQTVHIASGKLTQSERVE